MRKERETNMTEREKLIQDTSIMTRRVTDMRDRLADIDTVVEREWTIRNIKLLEELIFTNQERLDFLDGKIDY